MTHFNSHLRTLSVICLATTCTASIPKVSPTAEAIKSMETSIAVFKAHPECLAKIDVMSEDLEKTLENRIEIIKNDIPRDERKVIEKAVKDEAKLAFKSIEQIFKKHAHNIENKVDATIGTEKRKQVIADLEHDGQTLVAKANEMGLEESCKELGKDLEAAQQANMRD
ncbi:MAG: hypothetical protein WCW33_03550 [Candidatus Babeliales bacterium]|jgi:hypothetical protein